MDQYAYNLLEADLSRLQTPTAADVRAEKIEQVELDAAKQRAIRNEDVRRLTGLDSTAVGAMLRRFAEHGLLERRGEKRGAEYVHTGL